MTTPEPNPPVAAAAAAIAAGDAAGTGVPGVTGDAAERSPAAEFSKRFKILGGGGSGGLVEVTAAVM